MAYPSTYLDIQNAVIAKGRLDSVNDLTKVKDWINQAYYQTCIETQFFESSSAAAALTSGATNVTIPAAIVSVEFIVPAASDGTLWGPMDECTFEEVLELRAWAGGTQQTGAPSRYAYRSAAAPTIEFWPNANGGETLTFYGASLPTALSGNTDVPIFPEPYATKCLEFGALVEAAMFKKDLFFLSQYQSSYVDWTARFRAFNNTRVGAKVQSFRVENQRPYPKGNSVDQGV